MKFFYRILFLFVHTSFLVSGQTASKKETDPNATTITVGSSASIFSKIVSPIDKKIDIYRRQQTPPLNFAIDIRSNSSVTAGFSLFYEEFNYFKLDTNATLMLSRQNNLYSPLKSFSIPVTNFKSINPSLRILLHSNKNDNDFYIGLRLGYQLFLLNNNARTIFGNKLNNQFTGQLIVGYRKYFNRWGVNVEGCIGRPYWFLAGLNYRITGGKND